MWILALFLRVLLTPSAIAAEPYQPLTVDPLSEPWRWRVFPQLAGMGVLCMTEAADGTLWFGTADGLWHFDGVRWQADDGSTQLPGGVLALHTTGDGRIFAAGRWGISEYRDGTWSRRYELAAERDTEVRRLVSLPDGTVWAASSYGAVELRRTTCTLHTTAERAAQLRAAHFNPAPAFSIQEWPAAVQEPILPGNPPALARHDLFEACRDAMGRLWFGTSGGELLRLTPAATPTSPPVWELYNEKDGLVRGLRPYILGLKNGEVWVTYETRSAHLNQFDGTRWRATPLATLGLPEVCVNPLQTRDGAVWLSARYVVSAFREGRWRTYERPAVPIPRARNILCATRDGALWIAGPNTEILRIDYSTHRWRTLDELMFQGEDSAGREWFIHQRGRIVCHDGDTWTSYGAEDGGISVPVALIVTRAGDVWVAGSHENEAATARFDGRRWTRTVHANFSWGIDGQAIWEGFDGALWFGAAVDTNGPARHRAGILEYRDGRWIHHHQPGRVFPGEADDDARTLLPATQSPQPIGKFSRIAGSPDGRVWAGRTILAAYDGKRWQRVSPAVGVSIDSVDTLFTSEERDLWLGTRRYGAIRYDGRNWWRYQGSGSLEANSVRDFAQTADGTIWAATDRGYSRFDGQTWTSVLPGALTLPDAGGSLRAGRENRIWINHYPPEWLRRGWPRVKPGAHAQAEAFRAYSHVPTGTPPDTVLRPGPKVIGYPGHISVLWDGTAPWATGDDSRLEYSYRLDGGPWSAYTADRGTTLFSLGAGEHLFEVRARDRSFNVDPTPAKLRLKVQPPVWRQAWFVVLLAALVATAAVLLIRVLLERARLRRTNRVLAEEIKSRERTEAALRTSQAELKDAQHLSRLGTWHMSLATQQLEWSEEVVRTFELDASARGAPYDRVLARVHPDDRERVHRAFRRAIYDRLMFDIEFRVGVPDGRTKYVRAIGRILAGANGQSASVSGSLQDITDRKESELQLRESEERFRQLAETITDAFWVAATTPEPKVLYVSPAFESIWGRRCSELIQDPGMWLASVHADDRERVSRTMAARAAGVGYDEEYRILRPDGAVSWVRDRAFPVQGAGGKVERMVGVARDVTSRRQMEAQLRQSQKMEAVGQLAGGVAHDFNNILSVIVMQVELAHSDPALPTELQECLQEIRAAALRAANLTRQLLLFSRRQELQSRPVDLNEVVGNLGKMLRRLIGEDIHLEIALHPSPLRTVADPGMLDQVVMNLVINSRDAMPAGGRLQITTAPREIDAQAAARLRTVEPGSYVALTVTDSGAGIPPDVLPHVFEPFFTTKEAGKGTGLGLATVFGIVKQHRGGISVSSQVGEGTRVEIFLPVITPTENAPDGNESSPAVSGGSETILLVEDEPSMRLAVRGFLERHGYHVIEAESGARGRAQWEQNRGKIRLLLTDIVMPGRISGRQLARELRAEDPALKVIYASGYAPEQKGEPLELEKADRFLPKPFAPEQLLRLIRSLLDAR